MPQHVRMHFERELGLDPRTFDAWRALLDPADVQGFLVFLRTVSIHG
jgi:hypothetical protein